MHRAKSQPSKEAPVIVKGGADMHRVKSQPSKSSSALMKGGADMHRIKSLFLTFLCAGMILGAGYLVIVKSGQKVLERERILEESVYEDTSSNIFYGKIEEDVELFPWSYYPKDSTAEITGDFPKFQAMALEDWDEEIEAEMKEAQNWYLYQMIGWQSDTPEEEVWELYRDSQKSIMDSMVRVDNSPFGPATIYFYQDVMQLGEKQYQIRIACSDWNVISFNCFEYRSGQERDREAWAEGKEKLAEIVEESEDQLAEYYDYMILLRDQDLVTAYDEEEGYINTYLQSLYWLEEIMNGREYGYQYISDGVRLMIQDWNMTREEKGNAVISGNGSETETSVNADPSYSYQIVELKDMILLLMQGEETLGIFYDPMEQHFCGFNFFYEY